MDQDSVMKIVCGLVDEYRPQCLWFLRDDFYPTTTADALRVLRYIEQHGSVAALRRVAPLKQWLSQHSNAPSAV